MLSVSHDMILILKEQNTLEPPYVSPAQTGTAVCGEGPTRYTQSFFMICINILFFKLQISFIMFTSKKDQKKITFFTALL